MERWKFCTSTTFEILPLSTCSLCQQKSYCSNGILTIYEIFGCARRCWGWASGKSCRSAGILLLQCQGENFAHRQYLKFCHFQPVHCASKNRKSSTVFNRFSKSLPQPEDVEGGHFGGSFRCALIFLLPRQGENFAHRQHLKFATFKTYTVQAKILYLESYSTAFRNLCLSSKTLRVGIWAESFRCARVLLLKWEGENFAHEQHLEFWHFQSAHCASKNPISLKVFNPFSKSLPQLGDVDGGHLGGKFQMRRYFTFAMGTWKLCASTTFEILPLSTCTLCQQKPNNYKGIQLIFEIFTSTRRCWGWTYGWEFTGAQVFYFCKGKVKTLRIDNIWNFSTFNLVIVPSKNLHLQRYSTDFRNLCLSSKMLRVGVRMESFRCECILLLQWQGANIAHRQHLKFCNFQNVHCASQNPVSAKVFNRFSKSLPQLADVDGGHLGGKFQMRRYFNFAMATWKLCASTTFEILPLSTCILCQQKSYISKGIHTIFETFVSARRCWRWAYGGKFQVRRYFTFAMARWKLYTSKTFEILPLSTCTLWQQKPNMFNGTQPIFLNLCLSSKMLRVGTRVRSFRCARILLLQWKGENFALRQYLKFSHFQSVNGASKNPISLKVFNRFSKSLPQIADVEVRIWVKSFRCAGILILQWQRENFAHRQHLKFCHFQNVHCASKNHVSAKVFNRYSKSWPQLEDVEGGNSGESFRGAGILLLQCQGENFAHRQYLKFCHFQPVHCASKNPKSSTVFNRFSKSLPQPEDVEGGHLGGSFRCALIFLLPRQGENFAHRQHLKFATFKTYTVQAKILYLESYSTDFRNLCLSSKMLRVGIWAESFRCARVLLLKWEGENFAHEQHLEFWHFQSAHCASKNPISLKVFNPFSKSLPQLGDVDGGHLGGKFQMRRYFTFAMGTWKLCASTTFEILPLSTCTLCQQKPNNYKGIQLIFEIFTSTRRCWGWTYGWEFTGAQVFYFCKGKVKTLRIDNIWNFSTFNLYIVPSKNLHLQRYSTDFRNLCLSSKMLRVGVRMESFRCECILLLQWQGANIAHRQHLKFCNFQNVHCASQNPVSAKVFNRFSKSLPQLADVDGGHFGGKFQMRRYFNFAMATWKLCASTTFEILPLSTCILCQQKSYISKGIHTIFETFVSARRCWRWAYGGKFQVRRYFTFAMARWKLYTSTTFEIFTTFNLYTVAAKTEYVQRYSTDFFKSLPQLEDVEGGH